MLRRLVIAAALVCWASPARAQSNVCADGPTLFGIDVSRFQGTIDWDQVKGHNVVYAWIQISRSLTDVDAKFEFNWSEAKRVGILRGAYQRFQPNESVSGQANLFLEKLGEPQPGDLPPLLDVEDHDGMTPAQIQAAVQEWMDIVEPVVGVKPIIYTGYYFWKDYVANTAAFNDHPLWIANYSATCPLIPNAWSRWTVHQYSSTYQMPGITANTVDVNKFNGTMEDLLALTIGGGPEAEPCEIIPGDGGVVDDTGPCFRAGGPSQYIREENAGYGSFLKWTHATNAAAPANFGVWDLHFEEGGTYLVEAYTAAPYAQSKQAVYQITHDGQTQAVEIDQTAVDGWSSLGEITFAAGGSQTIRVDDNTGEPNEDDVQLVFDAVRFTRVGGGDDGGDDDGDGGDDGGDDGEPGEDGGGNMISACAAGGGASAPLALAVALLFAVATGRRRRRTPGS